MIDLLIGKIDKLNNPTVVGLDPQYEMIPRYIREKQLERHGKTLKAVGEMFYEFNRSLIDALCDIVPAVKPQIAMYERYGLEGIEAYLKTIAYAREKGMFVIGDIKRGDIASTAAAYAGHIGGVDVEGVHFDPWKEDAVTINPYLGYDGIKPFREICEKQGKMLFILVKTSNPSSSELQDVMTDDGRILYERTGDLVADWGEGLVGKYGYSRIGAVVGATNKAQGEALRHRLPHTFFLVPGYGAQGAGGSDIGGFFDTDGRGCIVNSSRGIIAAYKKSDRFGEADFASAAREAALSMKKDITENIF